MDQFVDVMTKKADATVNLSYDGYEFMRANKDKIKPASTIPLTSTIHAFPLPKGDYKLKEMLDITLNELVHDGTVDKILNKHDIQPSSYIHLKNIY